MTGEQAALLRKAKASLEAAGLLNDRGFHEFAASRAYYSMFYIAEAFLLDKGLSFSKHSAVIASFGKEFIKSGLVPSEYHRYLIDANDARNVSDYDIVKTLSSDEAGLHIRRAEEFWALAVKRLGPLPEENAEN